MTKNEIKKAIENEAATIENGSYEISFAATKAIYSGNIPFAATKEEFDKTDFEDTYVSENGTEFVKTAVIIEKTTNGIINLIIDNGECYPMKYSVEEFVNKCRVE